MIQFTNIQTLKPIPQKKKFYDTAHKAFEYNMMDEMVV